MKNIEEVLQEMYPNFTPFQIGELKNRLVQFYSACAKIQLKSNVENTRSNFPENSSRNW